LRRKHQTGHLADRVRIHRVEEDHTSSLSGEAHIQQVRRRTEELGRDNLVDHMMVDRSLVTGHSVALEVGSQEPGRRSLEGIDCMG